MEQGFTASLELELQGFGVRVKLVEPGYGPTTSFTANGQQRMQGLIPDAYEAFAHGVFAGFTKDMPVTRESDVAQAVLEAASDATNQLRFPAGADALVLVSRAAARVTT